MLKIVDDTNPADYAVGAIIARFQVNNLHRGHEELLRYIIQNHKQVVVFLGIPFIEGTKRNPLNFETRKEMILCDFPDAIVVGLKDHRTNEAWSATIDSELQKACGDASVLLYGGRDSSINAYSGVHRTVELESDVIESGTDVRNRIAKSILKTPDFRAGVIYATAAKRDVTYPTVDVVAMNDKGQLLLARKPNETKLRFVGGFVDRTDESYAHAARREFKEETGCELYGLKYVTSQKINDWRYNREPDGIMTTLFLGVLLNDTPTPQDDIAELKWVNLSDLNDIEAIIVKEHQSLMLALFMYLENNNIKI